MAVSFVARKCTQCAGKLEYIKETKIWRCLYCGAETERTEQYDGLFTIKNVVRQSLLDIAYRRLDSAQKNIVECEKIDSRYVGTLISKIAYGMIMMITPSESSDNHMRNLLSQLKKNYDLLKSISTSITEEEIALYDFIQEADVYATLVLVFDSMKDEARRDHVQSLLNPKEVYSKAANGNLLSYAIKNNKFEMIDDILSNADNVDIKSAFSEILSKYPDGEKKRENIERVFLTNEINAAQRTIVEQYLFTTKDSDSTKSQTAALSLDAQIPLNFEFVITYILQDAGIEQTDRVVQAMCKKKLSDEKTSALLAFAFNCSSLEKALCVLEHLGSSGQFLVIPAKMLISLLSSQIYTAEEKVLIIEKCFEFKIENKAFESVVTNYLCHDGSSVEDRQILLDFLFTKVDTFPTHTVEDYILKSNSDGQRKPDVIFAIFEKELNINFFHDLLSKYMNLSIDEEEVKFRVIDVLSEEGLKIDQNSLIDYICNSEDDLSQKLPFVKRMLANGIQLRNDTSSKYIEKISASNFNAELFQLITLHNSLFSNEAVSKYLLDIKDREANKLRNLKMMIEHCAYGIESFQCQINHLNHVIHCNLLQAYALTTTDSSQSAFEMIDYLLNGTKMKWNSEINVSAMGMKFKKYVIANREQLSPLTDAVCERYKVYSILF